MLSKIPHRCRSAIVTSIPHAVTRTSLVTHAQSSIRVSSIGKAPLSVSRPIFVTSSVSMDKFIQSQMIYERRFHTTPPRMSPEFFNESKYTEAAWSTVAAVTKVADYYSATAVEAPMLLDVLLNPSKHRAGDNADAAKAIAEKIFQKAGVDLQTFRSDLEKHLSSQPRIGGDTSQKRMATSLSRVLDRARENKSILGDTYVTSEGLVLALAKDDDKFTKEALRRQNVSYNNILSAVEEIRKTSGPATSRSAETNYEALNKYGIDFTERAKEGKLDPVIGRDDEIRRAIQILSRRTKNNPVLIGDPGVGKTAIAEGIAQRMIAGDVPDTLKPPCKLIGLDMGALIAGAKMRGEFEERLKSVLEEVTKSDGEIVLFIDEMHTVVGAGASEGSMDASNLLKPALARGELRCIGATTTDEYRKFIEKDKALERRFQQVMIDQPSAEDTVSILRGLKPRYEVHHGVRIRDEALLAAAKLSHRYIPDRFLPDKVESLTSSCMFVEQTLKSSSYKRFLLLYFFQTDRMDDLLLTQLLNAHCSSFKGNRFGG
uniref:Clp R domain-containing protein n=1 Tax=Ditylum brightwellii TaxID=49249 RepID=A0A7S4UWQ6_9STRA